MANGKKGKAKKAPTGAYPIGYAKPPKAHAFKAGQSGNPSGRPKGSVSLHHRFLKEAERVVKIKSGGKLEKIPKIDVIIRRVLEAAMLGKPEAQRLALAYLLNAQAAQNDGADDGPALTEAAAKTIQMLLDAGLLK
jgi:hypothetical protein